MSKLLYYGVLLSTAFLSLNIFVKELKTDLKKNKKGGKVNIEYHPGNIHKRTAEYNSYFNNLYSHINKSEISEKDKINFSKHNSSPTYGEIKIEGAQQIISHATKYYKGNLKGKKFYDLGSGLGKFVIFCAKYTDCSECTGIELSTNRYNKAIQAYNMISDTDSDTKNKINFKNISILDPSINLSDADIIFISSLCFPEEILQGIAKKLDKELKKGAIVYSSKRIPMKRSHDLEGMNIYMTWTDSSNLNIQVVT